MTTNSNVKGNFDIQLTAHLEKSVGSEGKPEFYIIGTGSTTDIDRQGDALSEKALLKMQQMSNDKKIPVFGDHDHSWKNTMGYIHSSQIKDGQWMPTVKLEDPTYNADTAMLIHKTEHGTPIGLSIGGRIPDNSISYEKQNGNTVRVVNDIELYELSFVGIPANQNSSVISYIAKSLDTNINKGDLTMAETTVETKPVETIVAKEAPVEIPEYVSKKELMESNEKIMKAIAEEIAKITPVRKAITEATEKDLAEKKAEPTEEELLEKALMARLN